MNAFQESEIGGESEMAKFAGTSRREFLRNSGRLLIGFQMLPFVCAAMDDKFTAHPVAGNGKSIDSWLQFDSEGILTVITGKMELGQGIRTALMQMAAEELNLQMDRVRIIVADTAQTQDERYTAGSGSIEGSGNSIRQAAAEARRALLKLAADHFNAVPEKLTVENGLIQYGAKSIAYQDLIKGKQLEMDVTGNAPLKQHTEYKLVGKGVARTDIAQMAAAQPYYIQDMRLPGMVHVRVLRPPVYGAKLVSLPRDEVLKLPGVSQLVVNGSFVAVVAADEYQCIKALRLLREKAQWSSPALSPLPAGLYDDILQKGTGTETVEEKSDVDKGLSGASVKLEAVYKRPYHIHGSIGPSCAIAEWKDGLLTIWSHSQGVYPLRRTISDLLNLPEGKIRIIGVPGSGCYGHNGADDVAGDAALMAMQVPGKPVRVQWMREDEHQWEPYGSAMVLRIKGGLDAERRVTAWQTEIWSDTHSTRPGGNAGHLLAGRDLEKSFSFKSGGFSGGSHRNSVPLYDFSAQKIILHNYKGPLRTSALRSLGAYANIFALESFMDELAFKAGKDPVAFRLAHLKDQRAKAVVALLVEKAGWRRDEVGKGGWRKGSKELSGEGFAFAQYKNNAAYCAVRAEVLIDPVKKTYKVTKLSSAIDAGQTINSTGVINQTAGGMIQAASWTMMEEVVYDQKGIVSTSWDKYPILRFAEVPHTEVFLLDRPELEPMGAGEAAQGPTAAAIANAIFHATGSRLREIPLLPEKIDWKKLS
ncbi:CO or xanthine dehydrogenase, Mo-binding subunit [Dyadobacter soli]|uniref:CO or xanthine dehydrogenase, Mo-binding subunit n=1 Tax=Dyadobacter soli TaxID=659014 RepID=A0A1G7YIC5_9BACT|nr:molybdopterin cofactor-binding domain-containing protein [Dyadobacter soli]SDG96318.1 CO or xanthine dehydrogenase, Mo-binding subunit [Dyadobacter soli]